MQITSYQTITVSESKRLIAKGILAHPLVVTALRDAALLVTRGSTNHYIVEELEQQAYTHGAFLTGNIRPVGVTLPRVEQSITERIYRANDEVEVVTSLPEAIALLPVGSVVLKGGNLLNYSQQKAAVLIGSPTGGTIAAIESQLALRGITLLIPIGLEKDSSCDIAQLPSQIETSLLPVPSIHPMQGVPFTEIEAIKQFAQVDVAICASGGIAGAEGAISLFIKGEENEVQKIVDLLDSIQGEPSFAKR